jgi:hypothetical protein
MAVEGITGLKLNYWAMVNLQGFKDLVDAVGGVTLKVPLGGCLIAVPVVNASFALAASTAGSWLSPRSTRLAAATCASRQCPAMSSARSGRTGRKTQPGVALSASRRGRLRLSGSRALASSCSNRGGT